MQSSSGPRLVLSPAGQALGQGAVRGLGLIIRSPFPTQGGRAQSLTQTARARGAQVPSLGFRGRVQKMVSARHAHVAANSTSCLEGQLVAVRILFAVAGSTSPVLPTGKDGAGPALLQGHEADQ